MSQIWQDYDKQKRYIVDTNPVSPYVEVFSTRGQVVQVNPLLRFSEILRPLCQPREGLNEAVCKDIQNWLLHYLAHLDRLQGVTAGALKRETVGEDIRRGRYGQEVQQGYKCLTADEKAILLQAVLQHEEGTMSGRSVYRLTLQRFFPEARVYYQEGDEFLVYIPAAKSEINEKKVRLLELLFLDWLLETKVFWQRHFGIIGHEPTMHIGSIAIY
ncbi:MAG: hypothetical protein UCI88_10750 [Megasphaera massiliensis]|uniref:hypothetical protein n=1 Tax=Megasphaera massiliensis TaxID=1232428 RepID=UPI00210A34B0|nr:hypothetical protein [Megasphaera massiliensis]MCQ5210860.1 hypothetical protein [Megasphaera massiliensis]MEE0659556.1 hypothetical protein [Megasphaera massiliensis]